MISTWVTIIGKALWFRAMATKCSKAFSQKVKPLYCSRMNQNKILKFLHHSKCLPFTAITALYSIEVLTVIAINNFLVNTLA